MKYELIKTADGSHSLYVKDLDEHYHSVHGAIQEGKHVFASPLAPLLKERGTINILEIGLGTGLNVLLTYLEFLKNSTTINYTALEAFPLDNNIISQLNYLELLDAKQHQGFFNKIHESAWEQTVELDKNFNLHKIKNTLQQVIFENQFDIIYFDAFGPRVQPEMWTEEIFTKIYAATKLNGFLVTYCAKGEVKRTLKKVGFTVETLPGPPGKREMVRAVRN
ncbi:MAG: tRNA (5-methylaminomethyl-2-thiouridine)(34)-methyltransferase MnmD [Bacteroidetes bacterium]|nr:tRNA (5-methylaminomethyl-2-thiouridine)(34)-methyltransferase MnmD [Bacteroidota bacterium]